MKVKWNMLSSLPLLNLPVPFPDPTLEMWESEPFDAIWNRIKTWDINVPEVYSGYCSTLGNHVRAILDSLTDAGFEIVKREKV